MAYTIHTTQDADGTGTAPPYPSKVTLADLASAIAASNVGVAAAITSSSPSAGVGYTTGAGGAVVQGTDKSTTVVLSTVTGKITMNAAALNAATIVSFTLTNTQLTATDMLVIEHVSGGTSGAYTINAFPGAGSAVISVRNNTAGNLSEAIVLRFAIIRSKDA